MAIPALFVEGPTSRIVIIKVCSVCKRDIILWSSEFGRSFQVVVEFLIFRRKSVLVSLPNAGGW